LSPGFSYARGILGHAYLRQGRPEAALAEFERAVTTGAALDEAQLAYAFAVTGRRRDAEGIVEKLLATARDSYTSAFHIAMAYVGLGDFEAAFDWLERARDEHDSHVMGLNIVVAFAPLRSDPRFTSLTRRIGLTA
jgi:tetratricopeptide (TPR) repeat protein